MRIYRRRETDDASWWAYHYAGGKPHRKSMRAADKREALRRAREWAQKLDESYSEKRERVMLSTAIQSFLDHCGRNELARQTVRNYAARLKRFLARNGDEDISLWTPDDAYMRIAEYLEKRAVEITSMKQERVPIGTFFNYIRAKRWYRGENPADAKLHLRRKPRRRMKDTKRCTTPEEALVLRREGQKSILWPVLMLTRWAGLRRGEACTVRWSEVELDKGYLDVTGHEWGRKHPRRVWLAPWIVLQLQLLRPAQVPGDGKWPVWPYHVDVATKELRAFCGEHGLRQITFNDLRASFATECYRRGMTPAQESRIVGHGVAVAEKHYLEYEAEEARGLLPPDPLTEAGGNGEDDGKRTANTG